MQAPQRTIDEQWPIPKLRKLVQEKFQKRPCWMQLQVARAVYEGDDVVACAATGFGKTLSFWMPLLMAIDDGKVDPLLWLVSPLTLLGEQNERILREAGISAIAVTAKNANKQTLKDIEEGKYQVVVISPELIVKSNVTDLLKRVLERVVSIIFDEGHCISQWGQFRNEYRQLGALRYVIPHTIPFYVASATLPAPVLLDIKTSLSLRSGKTKYFMRSNDRSDIYLGVQVMRYSATSMKDLAFLIPDGNNTTTPPPKFVVFFDNIQDTQKATRFLRRLLPPHLREKIKWFHSTMTQKYRRDTSVELEDSDVWGICATDAFGMGMDLSDIEIVVQWRATCDFCTLWQRFGRGARGAGRTATAILIIETKDTVEDRRRKEEQAERRKLKNREGIGTKRKAEQDLPRTTKRPALDTTAQASAPSTSASRALEVEHDENTEGAADNENAEGSQGGVAAPTQSDTSVRLNTAQLLDVAQDSGGVQKAKGKRKGQSMIVAGSVMDCYANATHCEEGRQCRRKVASLFFDNDKTPSDDHLHCDPTRTDGCQRCAPKRVTKCCDLCQPDEMQIQYPPEITPAPRRKNRTGNKKFEMNESDKKLKGELKKWREVEAAKVYDAATLVLYGSLVFMPDEVITRIILCSHHGKITSVTDFEREVDWNPELVKAHGEQVVSLVREHGASPAPATPDDTSVPLDATASAQRQPSVRRCTACKSITHIKSNRLLCPMHPLNPKNAGRPATDTNNSKGPLTDATSAILNNNTTSIPAQSFSAGPAMAGMSYFELSSYCPVDDGLSMISRS